MKIDKSYTRHLLDSISRLEDEKAFESLFKLFYDRLLVFSLNYVHSKELAEEVISDVFMKIWSNRHHLHSIDNIETYLYIATKNQSLNYAHQLSVYKISPLKEANLQDLINPFDPEKELELCELQFDLNLAIESLPAQCKMVFKLIKEDGFKYKEVAQILNLSVRTVETQLVRAIKKLDAALIYHTSSRKKASQGSGTSMISLLLVFLFFL